MDSEQNRPRIWARRLLACGVVACGLGAITDGVTAQAPNPQPVVRQASGTTTNDDLTRPVAYIHGNVPVTRTEFGEFLMARGGADKLELFVNRKIIEHECARRGVTVTEKEMEAALLEDLEGLSIKKADFVKMVLPRYGKTLYEWMEDVIKPRLLLTKLCRERVKVTDEDLKKQFEREYGEKRRVQIIMWPKGDDLKTIEKEYAKIRANQDEFDRAARSQANPSLAASLGNIKPICKHTYAEDRVVEETAFKMTAGEVSHVIGTSQGYVVMKLHEIIPPDAKVSYETVRPRLEKQAYDERMSLEIPKYFGELRGQAKPTLLFAGPEMWRYSAPADSVTPSVLQGVSGTAPVIPGPMEKK